MFERTEVTIKENSSTLADTTEAVGTLVSAQQETVSSWTLKLEDGRWISSAD